MSKVIVEKNKPKFDPIELDIKITITTMEEYLAFKKDIEDINDDWRFRCELLEEIVVQLTEI